MSTENCATCTPGDGFGDRVGRRQLLSLASSASLGVAAFLLAGKLPTAFGQSAAGDAAILSAALYLEHEGIAAYQAGAESKLLSPGVLKVAVAFQSDHKYHRDGIIGVLKVLGVEPAGPERKYFFGHLGSEKDVLQLARSKENGAVQAYGTLASSIQNKTALNFGANVLIDEVRHRTVLDTVLGKPTF